jgi:hypothetical protein
MANVAIYDEPSSYRQATQHPAADDWRKAMESELDQLDELGMFTLTELPAGRKALGSKWVYRNKTDDEGKLACRKARLVILGNSAIPGTDYNPDQISSPVVQAETNRLLLALAARYNLEMRTVDVKGAYLNGTLKEEIYMKQPEGFSDGTSRVWRLHKTLYGLPQSGREHLTAVKRVYRYLRGTPDLGITYSTSDDLDVEMHADFSCPAVYTDADWADSKDDRKSISGYVSIFAGGATTWSSKKQATVALSTMEAEYIALSHAARENLWLRSLFTELNLSPSNPFPIFCDNRGAIDFTFNAGYHARSKHIDMRHHFIRDLVTSHKVSVHHCASEDNLADIFTKPLARTQHEEQVRKLGMTRV